MHEITTAPKFERVFGGEGVLVKCENPAIDFPLRGPRDIGTLAAEPQAKAL